MRPLRYSINVTLDGCVDHMAVNPSEDIHLYAIKKIAEADALLFGRTTYEMMEQAWRPPASDAFPAWTQPFARTIDTAKKYVVARLPMSIGTLNWRAETWATSCGR